MTGCPTALEYGMPMPAVTVKPFLKAKLNTRYSKTKVRCLNGTTMALLEHSPEFNVDILNVQ